MFNESTIRCQEPGPSSCSSARSRQIFNEGPVDQGLEVTIASLHNPCNNRVGLFADILTGCRNFVVCHLNGTFSNQTCPGGLLFSDKSSFCEWPFNVRCGETMVSTLNFMNFRGAEGLESVSVLPSTCRTAPFGRTFHARQTSPLVRFLIGCETVVFW